MSIHIHPYLDNLLLRAPIQELLQWAIQQSLQVLSQAGFTVNLKKLELFPFKTSIFIGGRFRKDLGLVFLLQERIQAFVKSSQPVQSREVVFFKGMAPTPRDDDFNHSGHGLFLHIPKTHPDSSFD
jgi:hypothetical protein